MMTTIPVLLLGAVGIWAGHQSSPGSTMVVTPAATGGVTPTSGADQRLAKISALEVKNLPPGTKLFLSGDLRGMVWRSYILQDAPNNRLILSASVGDVTNPVSVAGAGLVQTPVTIRGDHAVLTRGARLARIDWTDVRQHVDYTVLDSAGILTDTALIEIADGLTAM
jgi:hypothetical protein